MLLEGAVSVAAEVSAGGGGVGGGRQKQRQHGLAPVRSHNKCLFTCMPACSSLHRTLVSDRGIMKLKFSLDA